MTRDHALRRAREAALWVGAALGALCLLLAALAWIFDIRPLVFRSGSMSPAIESGALALGREVPAAELREGDVVSVVTDENVRVTHRIVDIEHDGDSAVMHLKGDANAAPDAETYTVDEAYRVFVDVPWAGRVVSAASTPWGLLGCGAFVALLLVTAFGGGGRGGTGDDRPPLASLSAVVVLAAAVLTAAGSGVAPIRTMATFSDTSRVTGAALTALTVPAPTSVTCTTGLNATITWPAVGPNYSYFVTATRVSDGFVAYAQPQAGNSITFTTGLLGNLLSTNFVARIRAVPTGATAWLSSGSVTANFRSRTLGLGTACGHL